MVGCYWPQVLGSLKFAVRALLGTAAIGAVGAAMLEGLPATMFQLARRELAKELNVSCMPSKFFFVGPVCPGSTVCAEMSVRKEGRRGGDPVHRL